jgi:tyrosine-protein kinase Etk/Wzc
MIQIQPKQQGISSLGALSEVSGSAGASGRAGAGTIDEIEIIKSRSVIGAAIEALQLNVNVTVANRVPLLGNWLARTLEADEQGLVKPPVGWLSYAWGGERLEIDQIKLPQSLIGKPLLLTVEKDSQWQLTEQATGQVLAKGQGNDSIDVIYNSGFAFKVKDLSARPNTQFVIRVVANQSAVGGVLGGLTVTQVRGGSLIDLTFQNPDPAFAALMLNTITNVYLKQSLERSSLETERTIEFINTQLPELREKLDQAENNLTQFRVKSKIVDMTAELGGLVAATSQLQAQKMELDIKRQEMSTRYDAKHPIMRSLAAELEGIEQQSASLSKRINYLPSEERNYVRLMQNVEVEFKTEVQH